MESKQIVSSCCGTFKVPPYSSKTTSLLRMKTLVICARSKANIRVPNYYDINMTTKTDSERFLW